MTFTVTMSSAGSILAAMTEHTPTSSSATLFKVDTGASRHITQSKDLYKDFDKTTAMDFDVVHGESVRSLGS
eukprot:1165319-Prorocentrum_minimum.AAC.1